MSSLVLLPRLPFAYASSEAFPLIVESWISSSSAGSPQALRQKTRHSSSGWVVFLCFLARPMCHRSQDSTGVSLWPNNLGQKQKTE